MDVNITGTYGYYTQKRMAYIQRCYGMDGSGICDEASRDLLLRLCIVK
ncbi:MAG: hypothetical protein II590_05620 [Clostridia bacterium]|nr:hypothetical protein [Clostridia bacterium]